LEGRVENTRTIPKGGEAVTIFEAIMIALTFGILIVELVKLVFIIVESVKK